MTPPRRPAMTTSSCVGSNGSRSRFGLALDNCLLRRSFSRDLPVAESWRGWRILLIAACGEKLTDSEREVFKKLTGRLNAQSSGGSSPFRQGDLGWRPPLSVSVSGKRDFAGFTASTLRPMSGPQPPPKVSPAMPTAPTEPVTGARRSGSAAATTSAARAPPEMRAV